MKRAGSSRRDVSDAMIDVCHRLYDRGLVSATDGNITVRIDNKTILATRSGFNKGMACRKDLVWLRPDGRPVRKTGRPSTEIAMHLYIYEMRPDVRAVVHAHPPYATSFAVAGIPLDRPILPEAMVGLGPVPLAPYATPSTKEVTESIAPFVGSSTAILLANHGVVTFGGDLYDAYFRMEKVEHAAMVIFRATLLGGARRLSGKEIQRLKAVAPQSYGKQVAF
jgi:L-fuculose-phosphate aldolase